MFNAKKIAISLAAAALMMGVSTSAFAAFADMELIRVYYDRAGAEIATDLGKVSDLTVNGKVTTIGGSFDSLTTGYAVYFAIDRTNNDMWASGSTTTATLINGTVNGMTAFKSGTSSMYTNYNAYAQGNTYTGLASASNSYRNKLSATQGNLANSLAASSRSNTEASLTSLLGNTGASITQALYYWSNGLTTVAAEKIGFNAATIVTNADGSTVITGNMPATATPIPAAIYLLGSGLLGLVGVRRRNKA